MNRAWAMRCVVMLLASCAFQDFAASQPSTPSDLIRALSSANFAERRQAVFALDPEKIGSLPPGTAVEAVLIAAQDADAAIRKSALGGLLVLALTVPLADTRPAAAPFAKAILGSRELRPMLERILREDPSFDIALAASMPFMALYGSDPEAESLLLDRVDREHFPLDKSQLLNAIPAGGIQGKETIGRLVQYLREADPIVQHKAALVLLSTNVLRVEWLEDYLRVIEAPASFADPNLVRALLLFNVPPERYAPRLQRVRERLEKELKIPRDARTLAVYNDELWETTLDEVIAAGHVSK